MRLTTKGRYAVTAMLDLALHVDYDWVCLSSISKRQGISLSYLEQLFGRLRKKGLVVSVRGPNGGYQLSRNQEMISVAQVIDAVDESLDATKCKGTKLCNAGSVCLTHTLWADLNKQIYGFLNKISLYDLVNKPEIRKVFDTQISKAICIN